jgi:hypothetical protein
MAAQMAQMAQRYGRPGVVSDNAPNGAAAIPTGPVVRVTRGKTTTVVPVGGKN